MQQKLASLRGTVQPTLVRGKNSRQLQQQQEGNGQRLSGRQTLLTGAQRMNNTNPMQGNGPLQSGTTKGV